MLNKGSNNANMSRAHDHVLPLHNADANAHAPSQIDTVPPSKASASTIAASPHGAPSPLQAKLPAVVQERAGKMIGRDGLYPKMKGIMMFPHLS